MTTNYGVYGTETPEQKAQREADAFDKWETNEAAALSKNYPEMAHYLEPDVAYTVDIPAQAERQVQEWKPNDAGVLAPAYTTIPATEATTLRVMPQDPYEPPDYGVLSDQIKPTTGLTGIDYQLQNQQNNMIASDLKDAETRDYLVGNGIMDWYPATTAEKRQYGWDRGGMIKPASGMQNRPFTMKDVTGGGDVIGQAYAAGVPPIEARGGKWVDDRTYMAPDGTLYTASSAFGVLQEPEGPITWKRGGTISQIEDVAGAPAYGFGQPAPRTPVDPNTGKPVEGGGLTPAPTEPGAPAVDLSGVAGAFKSFANKFGGLQPSAEAGKTVLNVAKEGVQYFDGTKWDDSLKNPALGTVFGNLPQGVYDWVDGAWKKRPATLEWDANNPAPEPVPAPWDSSNPSPEPTPAPWQDQPSPAPPTTTPAAPAEQLPGQVEEWGNGPTGENVGDMPTEPSNDPYGDRLYSKLAENGMEDLFTPARNIIGLESGNDPTAHNTTYPDNSVGLFQINMEGQLGVDRAAAMGAPDVATAIEWLKDPETNINFAVDYFIKPRYDTAVAQGLSGYDLYQQVFQPWSTANEAIAMYYNGGSGGLAYAGSPPSNGLTAADASYTTETTSQGSDAAPIYPVQGPVTQRFGEDESGLGLGLTGGNKGLDFGVPVGTEVRAPYSGEVVFAGSGAPYGGWGNVVVVRDADGNYHQFGHLDSIGVSVGDFIDQGAWVGNSGNTGISTGPHLSWDVYRLGPNGQRQYFDPSGLLVGRSA